MIISRVNGIILAFVSGMALLSCSGEKVAPEQTEESLMDISRNELATAVSERDELLGLVRDIAEQTEKIRQMEDILDMTRDPSAENATRRRRILGDIAKIQQTLQERRRQLALLEEQMKESSLYSDELQGTIDALRHQIDSRNREIEGLRAQLTDANARIGELNSAVDSLTGTVKAAMVEKDAADRTSARLADELNQCYYVAATRQELKTHRIIETSFLRKTRLMKGDFDRRFFTAGDKRSLDSLNLYSRKASLLTNHPASSYRMVEHDGMMTLRIIDPGTFWSLTNYMVIQTD